MLDIGIGSFFLRSCLILTALSTSLLCSPLVALAAEGTAAHNGNINPADWAHFIPQKFHAPERLVPSFSLFANNSILFSKGAPQFPHDPSRQNVIYGRGAASLPTEIYAKAFDVLSIAGKYYQAPAAGERKDLMVNGQLVSVYGTSVYTPLRDTSFLANPVQVLPFNPTRIFYKENSTWPCVIYGMPGEQITIAGQKFVVPAEGKSETLVFTADGRLKSGSSVGNSAGGGLNSDSKSALGSSGASSTGHAASSSSAAGAVAASASGSGSSPGSGSPSGGSAGSGASSSTSSSSGQDSNLKLTAEAAAKQTAEEAAKKAAEEAAQEAAAEAAKQAAEAAAKQAEAEAAKQAAYEAAKKAADEEAAIALEETTRMLEASASRLEDGAKKAAEEAARLLEDSGILSGDWELLNKGLSTTARVNIKNEKKTIEATIIDQGTGYIPVGKPRFKGDYSSISPSDSSFPGQAHRAYYNYQDPYWEPATIFVLDINNLKVEAPTGNLLVRRSTPIQSSSEQAQESQQSQTQSQTQQQSSQQQIQTQQQSSQQGTESSQGTNSEPVSCP